MRILVACLAAEATLACADPEVQGLAIATGLVVATALAIPPEAEVDHLSFGAGRFDPIKNVQPATTLGIEYRFGRLLWWKLAPFLGVGVTTQHSVYGYGGVRLAAHWGERVAVSPSFAIGGYSRGGGKDLGHPPVVGRFGLDVEYRFDNDLRLGLGYHHFSNGKVLGQTNNPGTEIIAVTVSLPVR